MYICSGAYVLESRLFFFSGLLVCLVFAFALLGERTLSIFDGDRTLAARAYKSGATLLAGGAFALAMPKICQFFATRAQTVISAEDSSGRIARTVLSPTFPDTMLTVGYVLLVVFLLATITLSVAIWMGRA